MNKQAEDKFIVAAQPTSVNEARQALWSLELTIDSLNRACSQYSRTELVKLLGKFLTENSEQV